MCQAMSSSHCCSGLFMCHTAMHTLTLLVLPPRISASRIHCRAAAAAAATLSEFIACCTSSKMITLTSKKPKERRKCHRRQRRDWEIYFNVRQTMLLFHSFWMSSLCDRTKYINIQSSFRSVRSVVCRAKRCRCLHCCRHRTSLTCSDTKRAEKTGQHQNS